MVEISFLWYEMWTFFTLGLVRFQFFHWKNILVSHLKTKFFVSNSFIQRLNYFPFILGSSIFLVFIQCQASACFKFWLSMLFWNLCGIKISRNIMQKPQCINIKLAILFSISNFPILNFKIQIIFSSYCNTLMYQNIKYVLEINPFSS